MLCDSILDTIGRTPLVKLNSLSSGEANVYGKLEFFNPSGSVKDRAALNMIRTALSSGKITPDTVIIEPTSGNMGISLAAVCAAMGMRLVLVMPEGVPEDRVALLKAYGAKIEFTPRKEGMKGSLEKAERLKAQYGRAYIPSQFENPSNPVAHFLTTAREIYADLNEVAWIVAGIGSGGTVAGIKKYIDTYQYETKICGVEPKSSPLLTRGKTGGHGIPGIGANFIPKILDPDILDAVEDISDEDAVACTRELAMKEGVFAGISSGAAAKAAMNLAQRGEKGNIVVIFPDGGMKYVSTWIDDE